MQGTNEIVLFDLQGSKAEFPEKLQTTPTTDPCKPIIMY